MEEKETLQVESQSMEDLDINSDDSIPGTSHLSDSLTEENEMVKLKAEVQEQKDKYLGCLQSLIISKDVQQKRELN
jgi:hypothetical protein